MPRSRRSKTKSEGRFLVGEKAVPSLGAALAYAAALARREKRTVYVRVIGKTEAAGRAEYDDGIVTVLS